MFCNLCNKNIDGKFYKHLNSSHKTTKENYLQKFPEQREEYFNQIECVWNKGLTKESNEKLALLSENLKSYCNQDHIKKKYSFLMKERYKNGDILTPEQRTIVSKKGSEGWVQKLKSVSEEEKRNLLKNFTTAGNEKQKEIRKNRTPEDYMRIYPFAKGKACYGNCGFCNNQIIIWVGGKPRPKKRFCDSVCFANYCEQHPGYVLSQTGKVYHSFKMNCEFYLRSNLENWMAEILDESNIVNSWAASPLKIKYEYNGSKFNYFPDFLVNEKHIIEIKSKYVFSLSSEKTLCKLMSAKSYAEKNGYDFLYWQFNESNMTKKKFLADARIQEFFGDRHD
jgi:hypothetical protein